MFKLARPFFMITETPLHAGSGNDLGVVDMPIQRERHTGYPKVESSSLKGSLREAFENHHGEIGVGSLSITKENLKQAVNLTFGPEDLANNAYAGALGFTDARLLLFPVKSMKGVFAWITCPEVLTRFRKDMIFCGVEDVPDVPQANTVPCGSGLIIKQNKIVLEEYTFEVRPDKDDKGQCTRFAGWLARHIWPQDSQFDYWRAKMHTDIVVLTNDEFGDFVNLSTEIVTRTKIDPKTGTVQKGALFTEEYLPSDAVLYSLALATSIFGKTGTGEGVFEQADRKQEDLVMEFFQNGLPPVVQMGGNATIGKGFVRLNVLEVK